MRYTPLARLTERDGQDVYDLLETINDDLNRTDYTILNVVYGDFVVCREDENGDWEVVGDFEDYEDGDMFEASDPIAENTQGDYLVAGKPYGERMLIYDDSEE